MEDIQIMETKATIDRKIIEAILINLLDQIEFAPEPNTCKLEKEDRIPDHSEATINIPQVLDIFTHKVTNGELKCLDWICMQNEYAFSAQPPKPSNEKLNNQTNSVFKIAFTADIKPLQHKQPYQIAISDEEKVMCNSNKKKSKIRRKGQKRKGNQSTVVHSTKPDISTSATDITTTGMMEPPVDHQMSVLSSIGIHIKLQPFSFHQTVTERYVDFILAETARVEAAG